MKKFFQWLWDLFQVRKKDSVEDICQFAAKDCHRLIRNLYKRARRRDPKARKRTSIIKRGTGSRLCVKQGFNVFQHAYLEAENALYTEITPFLLHEGTVVELEWRYCLDNDENRFGDWGYHIWQVSTVE